MRQRSMWSWWMQGLRELRARLVRRELQERMALREQQDWLVRLGLPDPQGLLVLSAQPVQLGR
jgi:hypothetical protein